ncbi:helicase-related protein [Massilia horti]|nr:helicase-related protein [Massilia horti]
MSSESVMCGLKDFQQRTVNFAYSRMFDAESPALRFLVADEVGLGKTLVAKGLIARTIERLRMAGKKRIDVIYVCSNADIAAQNVTRLQHAGQSAYSAATRLTLLPLRTERLNEHPVNFISFTPGTTFKKGNRSGHKEERQLIYQMLDGVDGIDSRGLLRAMKGKTGDSWETYAKQALKWEIDPDIAEAYRNAVAKDKALMAEIKAVTDIYRDGRRRIDDSVRDACLALTSKLRRKLARTCLRTLQPDLVILDEFQRFGELFDDPTEGSSAELAHGLFNHPSVPRILLLSATPYKMYAAADDSEDHYADFLRTLSFLMPDQPDRLAQLKRDIDEFRAGLLQMRVESDLAPLSPVKQRIEATLKRVMCRTERVATTVRADAMVSERMLLPRLEVRDLADFRMLEMLAQRLKEPDTVEYWKSSPYLLNFMREYTFKNGVRSDLKKRSPQLADLLLHARESAISADDISAYASLDPGNARLRILMEEIAAQGLHRLLWMPSSLPYWQPGGVYEHAGPVSKQLIFSAWNVVPDALAALLSYEVERRIVSEAGVGDVGYGRLSTRFAPRLRLEMKNRRPSGMLNMTLMYPSRALVTLVDPLHWLDQSGGLPTASEVCRKAVQCLAPHIEQCIDRSIQHGAEDKRWYWVALARLEARHAPDSREWCENEWHRARFVGDSDEHGEPEPASSHTAHVQQWLAAWDGDVTGLGRVPKDLLDVLAVLALAGPATCALRSLSRQESIAEFGQLQGPAARIAEGLRSQFNSPRAIALLQKQEDDDAHWRRVLHYCIDGNLQALLDECVHLLAESPGTSQAEVLAEAMVQAMTLRSANIRPEELRATEGGLQFEQFEMGIRTHFAARFGRHEEEEGGSSRKKALQAAFNSPFWPFILVSTSVGQEGLDFHPWCHAVTHWNLPSNPVDMEQREGRVHRYKGYAVRKNVALKYGSAVRADSGRGGDPWSKMFSRAAAARPAGASDLIPYWIYEVEDGARVERRVMALPMSRDEIRYRRLKRSLALYRMVFAQPRQEDLLACLEQSVGDECAAEVAARWRIDLTPDEV